MLASDLDLGLGLLHRIPLHICCIQRHRECNLYSKLYTRCMCVFRSTGIASHQAAAAAAGLEAAAAGLEEEVVAAVVLSVHQYSRISLALGNT